MGDSHIAPATNTSQISISTAQVYRRGPTPADMRPGTNRTIIFSILVSFPLVYVLDPSVLIQAAFPFRLKTPSKSLAPASFVGDDTRVNFHTGTTSNAWPVRRAAIACFWYANELVVGKHAEQGQAPPWRLRLRRRYGDGE